MKKTSRKPILPERSAIAGVFSACAILAVLLGGCAYFDSLNPTVDDRIQLTRSDGEIRLGRREARDFTCIGDLILYCRDWGPTSLACGCTLP
jgi:hypothetical protein